MRGAEQLALFGPRPPEVQAEVDRLTLAVRLITDGARPSELIGAAAALALVFLEGRQALLDAYPTGAAA